MIDYMKFWIAKELARAAMTIGILAAIVGVVGIVCLYFWCQGKYLQWKENTSK